jgi:hypothetical protein
MSVFELRLLLVKPHTLVLTTFPVSQFSAGLRAVLGLSSPPTSPCHTRARAARTLCLQTCISAPTTTLSRVNLSSRTKAQSEELGNFYCI